MNKLLETAQSYTFSQIFSGNHTKIVIPDLQRDYCWGGKNNLVVDFVTNLIENGYKKDKAKLPLGLLYGYEEPSLHIQLCDGQQRITTLFLLIGSLNKHCNNQFQKLLISDFEYNEDDKEPYLQYSIRENSLYFLSDLVCNFFLENNCSIDNIVSQSWYFNEYNADPSIRSMLTALKEIESVISKYTEIDKTSLVEYITNDLSFIYYDMGSRASGEETFVIINTTGEPLSATENLKPKYVTKYPNAIQQWESWENWFWKNRDKNQNDTADSGLLEFFRWIIMLECKDQKSIKETQALLVEQEKIRRFDFDMVLSIAPEVIDDYLEVVKNVFSTILPNNKTWLSPDGINSQIVWFRVLPIIAYIKAFPEATYREIIRVKHLFKNLSQISNVTKDVGELVSEAVDIIRGLDSKDIAQIANKDVSKRILSDEEKIKFEIFMSVDNREEVEDAFWHIQYETDRKCDGKIWKGEIMPIIKWSEVDGIFNFEKFIIYNKIFFKVFAEECESEIDIVRRALLTRGLKDYPRHFSSKTNKSFGWEFADWKTLIFENQGQFGEFFSELISKGDINKGLNEMIGCYDENNNWAEFVHIPELMDFCNKKNIQWWGENQGWILVKSSYTSGEHTNVEIYKYHLELNSKIKNQDWESWLWGYQGGVAVVENKSLNIVIDVKCTLAKGDNAPLFIIELFKRDIAFEIVESELNSISIKFGFGFNGERYISEAMTKTQCTDLIKQLVGAFY